MSRVWTAARRLGRWAVPALAAAAAASAVLAVPAAGQDEADGRVGACGFGVEAAGFDDTAGLSPESATAIDCVVHYGIAGGATATAFEPAAEVTRRQAALFLARTLAALELDLPERPSAPFKDLAGLDAESRLAIAQLHDLKVTAGRSRTVFDPAGAVTRAQMALMLHRMLKLTGARLPDLSAANVDGPAHGLEDLAGASPAIREAAAAMLALRVMEAASPTRFDLATEVTRGDAALHLARFLELAGARPVRLEMSVGSVSVMVGGSTEATIRALKPTGEPYRGLLVDVFAAYGTTPGGSCIPDDRSHVNGGGPGTSRHCEIDRGDPRTDQAGVVRIGLAHNTQPGVGWLYAWTGPPGQRFEEDRVSMKARVRVGWQPAPRRVTVTVATPARFGEPVIVRARLFDRNTSGKRLVLVATDEAGSVRTQLAQTTTIGGAASFQVAGLRGPLGDRELPVDETVLVFWDRNGNSVHDGPAEPSAQTVLTWRRH